MTNVPKSRSMADARSIVGKRIDCAGSRLKLLTGISDDSRALTMTLAYQTIGRIVMSEKTALKIKKIVVLTIETTTMQMYPEVPITRETIIHKTTPPAVTLHAATSDTNFPLASRVPHAVRMATTRAEKLDG